ncbi:MAG: diaminopimelate epimerase [Lachnospiraceae bacterium]|nr:diaminopimelate epimerase [Lachnospiraceae bacterium]
MKYTKMHGLGNDYFYAYNELPCGAPEDASAISIRLSDRHFGIGSDGIIYISPVQTEEADFRMRMFNADGSEGKMCGNGIRCVGKYLYDKGYTDKTVIRILTGAGIKTLDLEVEDGKANLLTVDMGHAVVSPETRLTVEAPGLLPYTVDCIPVDMGNPHAVIFTEDAEAVDLWKQGPPMEKHPFFPDGANIEFITVLSDHELRMRVWERGSGITMACGTGACASAAAAVSMGYCREGEPITVHLDGGPLTITVLPNRKVFMKGPAAFIFEFDDEDLL